MYLIVSSIRAHPKKTAAHITLIFSIYNSNNSSYNPNFGRKPCSLKGKNSEIFEKETEAKYKLVKIRFDFYIIQKIFLIIIGLLGFAVSNFFSFFEEQLEMPS